MFSINCTTNEHGMLSYFSSENGRIIPLSYENSGIVFDIKSIQKNISCCNCGSNNIHIHEYHSKIIHGGSFNETPVYYNFQHRRFFCEDCNTTFMERFEALPQYARKLMDVENAVIHAMGLTHNFDHTDCIMNT